MLVLYLDRKKEELAHQTIFYHLKDQEQAQLPMKINQDTQVQKDQEHLFRITIMFQIHLLQIVKVLLKTHNLGLKINMFAI